MQPIDGPLSIYSDDMTPPPEDLVIPNISLPALGAANSNTSDGVGSHFQEKQVTSPVPLKGMLQSTDFSKVTSFLKNAASIAAAQIKNSISPLFKEVYYDPL